MNYDFDLGEILITDWSHVPTFQIFTREAAGSQVWMDTNLINGRGRKNPGPYAIELLIIPF
jgi:hypothetical protein